MGAEAMSPTVLALIVSYLHARQLKQEWRIPRTPQQVRWIVDRFMVSRKHWRPEL